MTTCFIYGLWSVLYFESIANDLFLTFIIIFIFFFHENLAVLVAKNLLWELYVLHAVSLIILNEFQTMFTRAEFKALLLLQMNFYPFLSVLSSHTWQSCGYLPHKIHDPARMPNVMEIWHTDRIMLERQRWKFKPLTCFLTGVCADSRAILLSLCCVYHDPDGFMDLLWARQNIGEGGVVYMNDHCNIKNQICLANVLKILKIFHEI